MTQKTGIPGVLADGGIGSQGEIGKKKMEDERK